MRRGKFKRLLSRNPILLFVLMPCLFGFTYPQEISVSLPNDSNKYYLDLSAGSNGNGTIGSPWNAWANAKSGISGKSRPCYLYVKGSETVSGNFVWDQGGSGKGSELVITNWPGETATTIMSISNTDGWRINATHLIIDGSSQLSPALKWYNSDDSDGYTVRTYPGCNNTTVLRRVEIEGGSIALEVQGGICIYNNIIHGSGSHCVYLSGSTNSGCRSPMTKGNIVYNAGRNGIQHNPHDSNRQIIDGETMYNCLFDNRQHGTTILSGTGSGGTINGLLVANNLIWDNGDNGAKWSGGSNYNGYITGVLFCNNTIVGGVTVDSGSGSVGTTFRNNILTGTKSGSGSWAASSNNATSYSTSNFVSASESSADFLKIKASNDGYDTNPPVDDDYFGGSRSTSAPDIGAHEYGGGGGTPANQAPNGVINSPSGNVTIDIGDRVTFAGTGSDPDGDVPLSYLWDFDSGSGITDSTQEDPGQVQFNYAGTFTITLTVTDAEGLADASPASVTITVQSAANQAPNGVINSPSGNVTIDIGDRVSFSGTGSDPDGDLPLSYLWDFGSGSGIPDSTQEDPGKLQFNYAGTFTVTLTVTDAEGLADASPDSVTITVQSAANQAPNGVINSPSGNVTIDIGDRVSFSGTGSDPDGDVPLSYLWDFGSGSGIPDSTQEDPGQVQFNYAGTFTVTFTVTDAEGLADSTPASVMVSVQGGGGSIIIVSPSDNWTKIESAQAGDVVEVLPGTYQFRVYLTNNGTPSNPIVIRAQDSDNPPVWDFNGKDCDDWPGSYTGGDRGRGGWQITGSYYDISGIIIRNAYLKTGDSVSNSCGMRQKGSQHIVVRDCVFENNDNGVSGYGEDILYEYCIMRYNGNPDGDMTHNVYTHGGTQTFRFCHIHDPDEGQNLHIRAKVADFEYCLIENAGSYTADLMVSTNDYVEGQVLQETLNLIGCVIVESESQDNDSKAFTLYNSPARDNVRMRINMYYNTFIGNGRGGAVVRFTNSGLLAQEAYLYNNIFYNNHVPFTFDTKNGVTAMARNNWWPKNYDYSEFDAYMSNSYFGTDPGFNNPGQGDYTLRQTSSCVGLTDESIGEIPVYQMDFAGTVLSYLARITANDLGAFETNYQTGNQPPSAPALLRVVSN